MKIKFYFRSCLFIFRVAFFPLQIGDHVFIGDNSIVNAAVVNSYVYIGKNVTIVSNENNCTHMWKFLKWVIVKFQNVGGGCDSIRAPILIHVFSFIKGRRCVLKDCCYIEDNSVLPPETVVPTFTRYSGSPAKRVGELPENTQDIMVDFTKNYYNHFTATSAPVGAVSASPSVRS